MTHHVLNATPQNPDSVNLMEQVNPSQNVTAVVGDETPPATNSSTLTIPAVATRSTRETLPKLELRRFNGELTSWMAFWDSFEATIHNSDELSSVDKFNYLNTLLKDSAAAAVAGLTLTSANYDEAVEILKKRFGNKQMIIAKHMDILMNLEAVTSQHDLKGLRHLYNLVESHTRGLASLGVMSSSYGALLSSVLITKLPQEFDLTVSKEIKEGEWDLSAVMKILEREIDARERAAANPGTCSNKQITRNPLTTAALLLTDPFCPLCLLHLPSQCKNVADVKARKHILLRSGRCFVCLKKGHVSKNCHSLAKCFGYLK